MSHIRFAALAAAAVVALSLSAPAAAAGAAKTADTLALLNCTGSGRQDFNPPLLPHPRQVTVQQEGTLSICLPNAHQIVNGSWTLLGEGRLDCLIGGNTSGFWNIEWVRADGTVAHSVAEYPIIAFTLRTTGQTVAVVTARVVSGLFAGHLLVNEGVMLQANVERCLLGLGVHTIGGPMNYTIV
jgi:hypothetical protein